ncbi:MAG: hypothetical protein JRF72_01130 [Deltaproteobacteria bacterium]|jgi:hypothetical protein|nr:hypothetical protein [Deltaproteobacteria bacterium]
MKINKSLFRSRLGQRIFLMFVACALLPIAGLFILSFIQVNKQLYHQSHIRLKQSAKAHGLSIYERLLFLEEEMLLCVTAMNAENSSDIHKIPDEELKMRLTDRFRGLSVYQQSKGFRSFFGESKNIPRPDAAQVEHIISGKTALLTQHASAGWPRIFLLRQINMKRPQTALLIGEVNPFYLWGGIMKTLCPRASMFVLWMNPEKFYSARCPT